MASMTLPFAGGGFNPTAQDAYSALLARMPDWAEAAMAARQRRGAQAERAADQEYYARGEEIADVKRQRQDRRNALRQAEADRREARAAAARAESPGPYGPASGHAQRMRYMAERRATEPSAAQRATSMVGGMTGSAYSDLARDLIAASRSGYQIPEYTGMTELARAGAGASQAAEQSAGRNLRQRYAARSGSPYSES